MFQMLVGKGDFYEPDPESDSEEIEELHSFNIFEFVSK